jgi:hypothetical protein
LLGPANTTGFIASGSVPSARETGAKPGDAAIALIERGAVLFWSSEPDLLTLV